jgi:hypothetical protein
MTSQSIPSPTLPPSPGQPGGLGDKIETTLVRFLGRLLDYAKDTLSHIIRYGVEILLEALEPELNDIYGDMLRQISDTPGVPAGAKSAIEKILSGKHEAGAVMGTVMAGAASQQIMGNVLGIMLAPISYTLSRAVLPFRVPVEAAIRAVWRGDADANEMSSDIFDQGLRLSQINALSSVIAPRPDPGMLTALMLRGEINEAAMKIELAKQGWTPPDAESFVKLSHVIPPIPDQLVFADRLVWDDQYAAMAGLDDDRDPRFLEWAAKLGLSPEWAARYWRAHWAPIDINLGFEMLHRGKITMDEMRKFLKAQNIPPKFQDKYIQVAYNVPTRVDLRRAYKAQVVTRDQVKRSYLDMGYDEQWATILTQWTVIAYAPEEKDITVSDVRGALERGTFSESEATAAWRSLDESDEAIAFYIAQARFKKAEKLKSTKLDAIHTKYVAGKTTRSEAASALTILGLPGSEIEADLELWTMERENKVRDPSYSDLRGFYLDNIIDAASFRASLSDLGYSADSVTLYIRSADLDRTRAAQDASAKLAIEHERLVASALATAYQKAIAAIDVRIAQERQVIASAQSALNSGVSTAEMNSIEDKIDVIDQTIASERQANVHAREQIVIAQNALSAKISDVLRRSLDDTISGAESEIASLDTYVASLDVIIAQAKLLAITAKSATDTAMVGAQFDDVVTAYTNTRDEIKSEFPLVTLPGSEIIEPGEGDYSGSIKSLIADVQVVDALLRERQEILHLDITNARSQLRLYITDDERQTLERTIRDADEMIAHHNANIVDAGVEKAKLQLQIASALNSTERAALISAMDTARKNIATLQLQRAQAKITEG